MYYILCLSVIISSHLFGNIFSTSDLQKVEEEIEKLDGKVLVLFDIDATLLVPEDAILRPAGDELLDKLLGGDKIQELPTGRRYVFREIFLKAPQRVLDERSLNVIQKLQEKGIPVIALTATPRGKIGDVESVADWRVEELKRFGFDFSSSFSNYEGLELPKDADKDFSPIFKSGILFASLHSKGEVLKNFLQATGSHPDHVVLIDDQMRYIQSVSRAAEDLGIGYVGAHYTAAEELPCTIDPDLGAFQVQYFLDHNEWKSDAEARMLYDAQN